MGFQGTSKKVHGDLKRFSELKRFMEVQGRVEKKPVFFNPAYWVFWGFDGFFEECIIKKLKIRLKNRKIIKKHF